MEEEFYKFVSPAEIVKDLNLPKELATKIHKFWALKRKVLYIPVNRKIDKSSPLVSACGFIWSLFTCNHLTCNELHLLRSDQFFTPVGAQFTLVCHLTKVSVALFSIVFR